jgi:hypothetical protein
MADTAQQLPGPLHLAFKRGDDYGTLIDFSVDLSGRSCSAAIRSVNTRAEVATFTITEIDMEAGQLNLSLTGEQTAELAVGTYAWSLQWVDGGAVRTALEGYVEVS